MTCARILSLNLRVALHEAPITKNQKSNGTLYTDSWRKIVDCLYPPSEDPSYQLVCTI